MTIPKNPRPLTAAEIDIIRLVSRGYTNAAIADLLDMKIETLRTTISMLHKMVGTSSVLQGDRAASEASRVRMVIWAYEHGIATQAVTESTDPPRQAGGQPRSIPVEHGSYQGWQRHKRNGDPSCDLCAAAKRGYDVGVRYGTAEARRVTSASRLADRAFAVCRQLVHKRPYPALREEAVAIIRKVDAEATIEAYEKAQAA